MNLYRITNAQLAFGDNALLNKAEFQLNKAERVCIVGRNGAGKSTLLKVIDEQIKLDDGDVNIRSGINIKRLEQDPPKAEQSNVYSYVAAGLGEQGIALAAYSEEVNKAEPCMTVLSELQHKVEQLDAWSAEPAINQIISRLSLDPNASLTSLSGGWLRKVALAKSLVSKPDILLLDEPTNHLDYQSIEWLENFLIDYQGSIVFISHDRAFIRRIATRIVDLDRGKLISFDVGYDKYLEDKIEYLRVEEEHNKKFDKELAQEEVWIRQGIKARRTRNEGRVRALKAMRLERGKRREVQGNVSFNFDDVKRSGKLVAEINHLSHAFADKTIVNNFSSLIMRGDKVALIGPNGCGKSTFIKLILNQLTPDEGEIKTGTNLDVAYFDQYRAQLDEEKTVVDNVADGRMDVTVNGQPRHVLGYLQDFLFSPKRARSPVKSLSGGEKNRLLLAKLFLKPSNLLVLDEPTNDLDVETLELLEELVTQYSGTLLLVSHDREFVNNTATSSYFFSGKGKIKEYVGGYDSIPSEVLSVDVAKGADNKQTVKEPKEQTSVTPTAKAAKKTVKLSYKQKKSLEELPIKIEQLETNIEETQALISAEDFFNKPANETQAVLEKLAAFESELEVAFELWEELDALENGN
jgi:ATP-binding cassette subfamily F protein uup